jgi:hypothetical protein
MITLTHPPQPFSTYSFTLPLKFPPEYSYYTDGSFFPPNKLPPTDGDQKLPSMAYVTPSRTYKYQKYFPVSRTYSELN